MTKTFYCPWCRFDRPEALMFYVKHETICVWCAEDNGLMVKRYMKGY